MSSTSSPTGPSKIKLGYWDIRGLAQPIRLLLEYAGAEYEEKRYKTGPAPDYDKSEWLAEKAANPLGLAFPNLPYLVDGDVKLTQTHAIMRYLGRKFKLVGDSETEVTRCELAEQQLADLRTAFVKMCYSPDFEQLQEGERSKAMCLGILDGGLKERFALMLRELSEFLGDSKWFAGGDRLTYVDFLIYEILFQMSVWHPASFSKLDNLTSFVARFEALPPISAYMKSERFLKWPFNNNVASYGSRSQTCPF